MLYGNYRNTSHEWAMLLRTACVSILVGHLGLRYFEPRATRQLLQVVRKRYASVGRLVVMLWRYWLWSLSLDGSILDFSKKLTKCVGNRSSSTGTRRATAKTATQCA